MMKSLELLPLPVDFAMFNSFYSISGKSESSNNTMVFFDYSSASPKYIVAS
jgi:hypothetical protein